MAAPSLTGFQAVPDSLCFTSIPVYPGLAYLKEISTPPHTPAFMQEAHPVEWQFTLAQLEEARRFAEQRREAHKYSYAIALEEVFAAEAYYHRMLASLTYGLVALPAGGELVDYDTMGDEEEDDVGQ
jgi:hypothetical protein